MREFRKVFRCNKNDGYGKMNLDKKPKVSIITVCYNSEKYIERAIKSVLAQSYGNKEYIIVDGGSKDNTLNIARKYKNKINVIISEPDNGIFDAMNKGIGLASGEIIYFLNSDDRFYDYNVMENAVDFFIKSEDADFIYGNIEVLNPDDNFSYIERYPDKITKWLFVTRTIAQPGSFFRAGCFKKCGCFDISYRFAADHDWYLKAIFVKKLKAAHIKDCISVFRLGGLSNNHRYVKAYFLERSAIEKKYFNNFELLCASFLRAVKMFLGRSLSGFLHRVKVIVLNRK